MDDEAFDRALVSSAFTLAGDRGWREVSVVRAARAAELPLDRARARFLGKGHILGRFGRFADQSALAHATADGDSRDRLFDLLMRRFDVLQAHRAGVLALPSYLPQDPGLALSLTAAHLVSMAFMLEAAGIPAGGWRGGLRTQGLLAVWLRTVRAWERDESEDLSATMSALDAALDRAAAAERWLRWGPSSEGSSGVSPPEPSPVPAEAANDPTLSEAAPIDPAIADLVVDEPPVAPKPPLSTDGVGTPPI